MASSSRHQVFISYSHKDQKYLHELKTHLKPYTRGGSVSAWSDEQIRAGSKWSDEIDDALANAKVAVLLVTPSFLDSDFIHENELGPLLKRAEAGGVTILWIPVRPSAYKSTAIAEYQAITDPARPLTEMRPGRRDGAWVRICEAIAEAVGATSGGILQLPPVPPSLRDLRRAICERGLESTSIARMVLQAVSEVPDLELAPNFMELQLTTAVNLSEALKITIKYSEHFAASAGAPYWRKFLPEVATPLLVGVARSLARSPAAQEVVIRLCKRIASHFYVRLRWPKDPVVRDRFKDALYNRCRRAKRLESDAVLLLIRRLIPEERRK
jgi:hypothetical protein